MSQKNIIMSIDQGTTGTTVIILNSNLEVLAKKNNEFAQHYPQPGWVEHDPNEIWESTIETMVEATHMANINPNDLACIGITNQRETTILWDKETKRTLHNAIVWQDRRTSSICQQLKKKGHEKKFRQKTGLVLDPYFSGTKINWLMHNVGDAKLLAKQNRLAFGTIDCFLVWKLTDGSSHVTDVSNASRTLLMDLKTLQWDKELAHILNVPLSILPEIKPNTALFGHTKNVPGFPDGIPITGMAGDQQAALFGQACFKPGEAKCTYGTGSFLLMNVGKTPVISKTGLLSSVAWKIGNEVCYALEGSSFIAGAAVQWLRDELKIIEKSSDVEALAGTVENNGGVYFVPALAGLGAPHWQPEARGMIYGLTRGSNRGHLARATLEGIAYQQMEILEGMQKDSGKKCRLLKVDGGASSNNLMMQFQSDILGVDIVRPKMIESTGLGAAFLAGLGAGLWKNQEEIKATWQMDRTYVPQITTRERNKMKETWSEIVRKTYS